MIIWDVSPEIFSLGPLTVRWYGLLFASSFLIGFKIMEYVYKKEGRNIDDLNTMLWYMIIGTVIGSRLGHCLFYNPEFYLSNPLEILMIYKGGLASHGGAIGILISLYMYSKKKKDQKYIWVLDRIVIPTALGAFFIRMGNLFNSEIIGRPTNSDWGFVFKRLGEDFPRHPAQLYESLAYLLIFVLIFEFYRRNKGHFKPGKIFGMFMSLVFGFRFFVEFIKEDQTYFEKGMYFNMGQLLSIPLVLLGLYFIFIYKKNEELKKEK